VVGVVLFGLSFLVHLVALGFGAVAVVQPLIVTELVFIPPLAAIISHAVITRKDWAAILSVCAGLAAFILVAQPSEGDRTPDTTQWLITLAATAALVAALMTVGRGQRDSVRATLFGVAAGLVNALLAILAKGAFAADHPGVTDWLTDPLVWLTVVAAFASVWSATLAFRAGPITSSTPAMISVNPIVSTLAAMWLFGEALRITPISVVLIGLAIVVVIGGVYVLSNSDAVHGAEDPTAEDAAPVG
jgi:drug/metabolite transporter (DMT)-like permease